MTGRVNKLETRLGLRGACRVCGGGDAVRYVVAGRETECPGCPGCGKPPLVYRIVARPPRAGEPAR
jgi:hypothetical protein